MLFLQEIKYRRTNFLLGLVGMVAAVTIVVLFFMMTAASQNETRRLTRDMGFNLKIIPDNTNMNDFWVAGYSNQTMPEEFVDKLVDAKSFYYAHLTATLHRKIEWRNTEVVLTGISPDELEPNGSTKSKMIFAVEPDKIYVGYEIADKHNIEEGDLLTVLGNEYEVERTLAETGSEDDIRVYFDLKELQSLLRMEGRINEIMALNCLCSTEGDDPLEQLRIQLGQVLPNTKVIMNRTVAVARERQRKMMDNYFAVLLPIILIACILWVGTFSMLNVFQRKTEIGIMRATGFGNWKIARLFFARALLTGLGGAFIGFFLATWLGMKYGPEIFKVTAHAVSPVYALLYKALIFAPIFAALAAFIPVVFAIKQDPAEVLKEA
ncbi:ABC transporter permease [Sunxiuqinia sp. sy24]|uniref:ABC transporter permease n=1 Tax=Sunxiuqinia sp. sy24 TaxID=3461495 RepID=UPI0040459470